MVLQSIADHHLLIGLCFFGLSFQFVILHLLIPVCTQIYHVFLVVLLVDFLEDYFKFLTCFSFPIHSTNITIQFNRLVTNDSISETSILHFLIILCLVADRHLCFCWHFHPKRVVSLCCRLVFIT